MLRRSVSNPCLHTFSLALVACIVACGDRSQARNAELTTKVDTIGDTIRVRTLAGAAPVLRLEPEMRIANVEGNPAYELGRVSAIVDGPAGGIYLWDSRLDELRLYDSSGVFVRQVGKRGQGPGEYVEANAIAPAPNDGVALWDPRTSRFTVFEPDGRVRTSWRWQTSMIFDPHALATDTAGNIYVPALVHSTDPSAGPDASRFVAVRVRPDGGIVDTLMLPTQESAPMLRAQRGGTSAGEPLPFAYSRAVEITPWGTIATSIPGRYAVDIPRPGARMLRIEREMDPVPVQDDERRDLAEAITRELRKVDPAWRWTGAEIPRVKPHIRALMFDADERLWVTRSVVAERRPASDTTPGAPNEWIEPTTYDIFERDGRLVGEVTIPPATRLHLALGDKVWAVQRDSLDVPTIVRFKLMEPR